MSQRLSESAVRDLEARGLERFTTPLGYRQDGSPFYLIGGASPDDPTNGDGTGGSGDGGAAGGSGSGSEDQSGGDGGSDAAGNNSGGTTVSKEEFDRVMERMKAADRNAAAAAARLKELEEKDLSEQEKIAKRLPELEAQVNELAAENKGLKAKVAFLGIDTHSWHDPDVALGQVDLSEVIDADGNIDKKALKKSVEDLAKSKPFLVKSANDDKSGGSGSGAQGNQGGGTGSSGTPAGSGGKPGSNQSLDEAALRKKYPALN